MQTINFRPDLPQVKTLVVKAGSRILVAGDAEKRLSAFASDVAALTRQGIRVVVVSSGAIAYGMQALELSKRPGTIPMKQACASIGQHRLMTRYERLFRRHNLCTGQVLLTWDDLRSRTRYFNLRNTLFQLLDTPAIPIVNENDSVGVEEIHFGDNDTLGAQIALLVNADLYLILTDVDGLYTRAPGASLPPAEHIPVVTRITAAIHELASPASSHVSVGGMVTKLRAAEIVTKAGIRAMIGNGLHGRLRDVVSSQTKSTIFLPSRKRMNAQHRWIAFAGPSRGSITVDAGARAAIVEKGKSLLPAGVCQLHGSFSVGDKVDVRSKEGEIIARGLINYSSKEVEMIRGRRTAEIAAIIGQKSFDEIIHRDNMALL